MQLVNFQIPEISTVRSFASTYGDDHRSICVIVLNETPEQRLSRSVPRHLQLRVCHVSYLDLDQCLMPLVRGLCHGSCGLE